MYRGSNIEKQGLKIKVINLQLKLTNYNEVLLFDLKDFLDLIR
jgi:hypothetical protein